MNASLMPAALAAALAMIAAPMIDAAAQSPKIDAPTPCFVSAALSSFHRILALH
jgi:hypothetical protein